MILSFLFYAFLIYLLYRLVFNFVLPIYRTTRQVKQKFRDMQEQMNSRMNGQNAGQAGRPQQANNTTPGKKSTLGEYIDYEEVKD